MDSGETHISTQCVDNVNGHPGVIVYEDRMYPLPVEQAGAGQGLHSSVRPFQFPRSENEDNATDEDDSLETDGVSLTSQLKRHGKKSDSVAQM